MVVFNVAQRRRRAAQADSKRRIHGDESGKLRQRVEPIALSGKRKRKMLKKWRRDSKEAVEKGLITMEDIEMAVADTSNDGSKHSVKTFPMKKKTQLKLAKQLKKKEKKNKKTEKATGEASVDSMVE